MLTLQEIIAKTTDLPSIPKAAIQVIQHCERNSTSAGSIAELSAQDQALSIRVLRLANSAYYGLSRQVSDLQEAVVVLGVRSVKNLALIASTYPWMSDPLKGYCLGPMQMWTHSFGTAMGAQLIAKRAKLSRDDTAFTAGLLHDLGKVALSIWLENRIGPMIALAKRDDLTFDEAERKVLGFDHTQVGEHLAESWNLPSSLVHAIRYHHDPNSCVEDQEIVDCVHLADYLTMTLGYGIGGDGLHYRIYDEPFRRLNLMPSDLDAIADGLDEAFANYSEALEELVAA